MKRALKRTLAIVLAVAMVVGITSLDGSVFAGTFDGTSPFSGVDYSKYYHNDRFRDCLILDGVDISEYQSGAKSVWTKPAMSNVDFAIMRVTWTGYGSSGSKHYDDNFVNHYNKAKAAGKMVGVYVFSQAKNQSEAIAEADYAIGRLQSLGIRPIDLQLPVYMDYEFAGPSSGSDKGRLYGISKSTATMCAAAFCERVRAYGYTPGIYANTSFLNNTIDGASLGQSYDIWCAQYYSSCQFTGNYTKWQYSSSAKIDGIYNTSSKTMNTDVNFWYINKAPYSGNAIKVYGTNVFNYTGGVITPGFEIYYGDKLLRKGTDYSIWYMNNVAQGTGYAYVKAAGSYEGEIVIPFTIGTGYVENTGIAGCMVQNYVEPVEEPEVETEVNEEAPLPEAQEQTEESVEAVAEEEPVLTKTEEESVEEVATAEVTEEAPQAAAPAGVNYGFDISATEIKNVQSGLTVEQFLLGLQFTDEESENIMKVIDNSGTEIAADQIVKTGMMLGVFDAEGNRVGTAMIRVNGEGIAICGKGIGPAPAVKSTSIFKISVKPTSIKSLKRYKKAFKVKVYKQAKKYVTGYQVRYSKKSSMASSKTKTISTKYSKVTKKVSGLKKKTTYYVQVRSYKKIGSKKYYSSWSPVAAVKTK